MCLASAFLNYRRFLWNFLLIKTCKTINQAKERERDSGKQGSKPQRMDFFIRNRFSPSRKCAHTCLETVKGVTATLNTGSVCQAAKKKVTFSSL